MDNIKNPAKKPKLKKSYSNSTIFQKLMVDDVRNKILFTILCLLIYRLGCGITILVPAAVVAQMLMFLVDKLGAAFYCGAFSSFTIVILNMIEKGYTYIYLALALAAMFGMMQRYHRD